MKVPILKSTNAETQQNFHPPFKKQQKIEKTKQKQKTLKLKTKNKLNFYHLIIRHFGIIEAVRKIITNLSEFVLITYIFVTQIVA